MIKYITVLSLVLLAPLAACASVPATSQPVPRLKPVAVKTVPTKPAQIKPDASQVERSQAERFTAWKRDFISRALAKGYDSNLLRATIGQAKINPKAILKDQTQPEFTRAIWVYVDGVMSDARQNGGRAKLAEHAALFADLESRYGVDRYILTAIWGLESAYGKIQGTDNMINSLSTLAFEGRRSKFGEQQLFGILDILAAGDVRQEQLIGSWAGAMGMTQFIPTTFRDYAVDYDNDGNKDLWGNTGDALASTAYYLKRFGWRASEPVTTEVILPKDFDYGLADGSKRTISSWSAMGIRDMSGQNWSNDALFLEAKLLIPAGANGPVFFTFKNFDVIKKYNNSTSYALGINVLADTLQGKPAIKRDWPRADKPLSLSQKKQLQQALTDQGYSTGGVDGMIGPNSRRAIRAWQRANAVPADAYVNQAMLKRIMAGR
ncbi:MAG: lytic murein transglycosylase [Robiginitomaculum sp.]|nr:lytic murein transglycosylase [Robiginitomaculum sp.]